MTKNCLFKSMMILLPALALLGSSPILPQSRTGHEFPWSWYEPEIVPWPAEKSELDLGRVHQPQINRGPGDELVVQGEGKIFHSQDGGKSWQVLCETPSIRIADLKEAVTGSASGVALLPDGTLLLATNIQYGFEGDSSVNGSLYRSQRYNIRSFVFRSADRGKTWSPPLELDPWPYDGVGTDASIRFTRDPDGTLYYPVAAQRLSRPGRPLDSASHYFAALLYVSTDGGKTFRVRSNLGKWTCEVDVLPLGNEKLLAAIRYQTPGGGRAAERHSRAENLQTPFRFKQTAVAFSGDGGRTWSTPRIVNHYLQQTGCLVRLADGTILLPFSHKDEGMGQRFIVSYDEGQTWSRTIFELNKGGMYASTVALSDDSLVTAFEDRQRGRKLTILRWQAPSREEASKGGFFVPPEVDVDKNYFITPE